MSNSGKSMRKLEQQLNTSRQKGEQEVSLQLSEEQAAFIKEELKLPISVISYEIHTQRIENVTSTMGLLQEIHRSYKRGKGIIYKGIHDRDLGTLKSTGVKFRPVKYRIILNAT